MTIQEIFNIPAIKDIEIEILTLQTGNERKIYSGPEGFAIEHLLGIRKHILDSMFVMDEHYKHLLSEFSEALRLELIEMRKRTISLYEAVTEKEPAGEVEVIGKCFLGYDYSKIHPIQTMRAKKMWAVLNGSLDCYIPLYRDGIVDFRIDNWRNDTPPTIASENEMLYLDEKLDNWNEELDSEMTKDMHLVYPFHNLFCHMDFSIFDLLWVRDFNLEICAEVDSNTYAEEDSGDDIDWDKCDYFD
jgi:hypothetical protein